MQKSFKNGNGSSRNPNKKIFVKPKQNQKTLGQLEILYCNLHKEQKIKKICMTKQCILPLCDICEELHVNDHRFKASEFIIKNFEIVKDNAQKQIQQHLQICKKNKKDVKNAIEVQKQKIIDLVQQYFQELRFEIENDPILKENINFLSLKLSNIKKWSLKDLVAYQKQNYNHQNKLKHQLLNLEVNYSKQMFTQYLKKIVNLNDPSKKESLNKPLNKKPKQLSQQSLIVNQPKDSVMMCPSQLFVSPIKNIQCELFNQQNNRLNHYQPNIKQKKYLMFQPYEKEQKSEVVVTPTKKDSQVIIKSNAEETNNTKFQEDKGGRCFFVQGNTDHNIKLLQRGQKKQYTETIKKQLKKYSMENKSKILTPEQIKTLLRKSSRTQKQNNKTRNKSSEPNRNKFNSEFPIHNTISKQSNTLNLENQQKHREKSNELMSLLKPKQMIQNNFRENVKSIVKKFFYPSNTTTDIKSHLIQIQIKNNNLNEKPKNNVFGIDFI